MTSDAVQCTHSTNVHESTTHKEGWSGTGKAEGPLGRIHYFESPHGVRSRLASGGPWDAFIHHPSATPKSLRLVVRAIRHRGIESQRVLLVPKLTPGEWRFTLDKVRQHYATGGFRAGPFRTQIFVLVHRGNRHRRSTLESTFVGPVMARHMTVGNRSKLCYILTSFTITYVPATCERLFRGNTNSGFIRPNIFPWGTSKSGGSFQDFFRGFFPNAVLVFPRLF